MTSTFAEQLAVLRLASREALDGWWHYWMHVRDKSPKTYPTFMQHRADAERTIERLAFIESVVGHDAVEQLLARNEARARSILAQQKADAP
jgi:hypothetical protein